MPCTVCYSNILPNLYICMLCTICYSNILLILYICMLCTVCYSNILLKLCICMLCTICYSKIILNLYILPNTRSSPNRRTPQNFWIMYLKSVAEIYMSMLFNDLLNVV